VGGKEKKALSFQFRLPLSTVHNAQRLIGPIMGMNMQFGVQYCAYGFPYQRIHLPLLVIEA
jgi:protein involved in ribonucleotide reduction